MKNLFLGLLGALFCQLSHAQSCSDCRYTAYVFDSVEVTNVVFGEGVNADGNLQELSMDIYAPYGDTLSNRPVMIFAFGGGFLQGSKDQSYVQRACTRFARSGYVAAAIDYRIGFDPLGLFPVPTEELMRVFFRAMQDMRGAIQWWRAHADQMGNTYRIDPDMIIAGGASAGAITSLMVAYCDKSSEFAEMGDTNAIANLGGFYSSSGNYPSYSWEVAGVFNIAGGIVDTDWMEPGDPPIISAHGDQDLIVPFMGGNFGVGPVSIGLEGSFNVDQAAAAKGICSYLYHMEGEGHPSGGESELYYDAIFNRATPRGKAILEGRSFCCGMSAAVLPGDTLILPLGQPAFLSASVGGGTASSIQWCDVWCQGNGTGSSFDYIPDSLPTYAILMARDSNCLATDFVEINAAPVGRHEPFAGFPLDIFPQPATDGFALRWEFRDFQLERLSLWGMDGRVLREWKPVSVNAGWAEVERSGLAPGTYLLRAVTSRGEVSRAVVFQ